MAKWSRKKKRYLQHKADNEAAKVWRKCHAPDGREKAVWPDEETALRESHSGPGFKAYYCEEHQGFHVGHAWHRRNRRMNARPLKNTAA